MSTSKDTTKSKPNNNKIVKISSPIELFLLFWVDEWDSGTKMFSEAAQTRLKNIKKSSWYNSNIHKVHCPPIQALQEIQIIINNYIKIYGGKSKAKIREVNIFSHSGTDGPITYDTPNDPPLNDKKKQMHIDGWSSIDFNWATYKGTTKTRCVFFGCRSAVEKDSFAMKISALPNYSGVEVIGQSTSSFPSVFPDYRVTTGARSIPIFGGIGWDIANTYMIGSLGGKGLDSITWQGVEKPNLKDFPKAEVMRFYKNNKFTRDSHQGVFNDHR